MRSDGVNEEEYLTLSGVQHYAFCPRQWALIFVEQQWQDNERTVDGSLMHARAHDETLLERRGDTLTARGLRVVSHALRVTWWSFIWIPAEFPCQGRMDAGSRIRWNTSAARRNRTTRTSCSCADRRCVWKRCCCAKFRRAVCIMVKPEEVVAFTPELRGRVRHMLEAMQDDMARGHTPSVKADKRCAACSMKEICLPGLRRSPPVAAYLRRAAGEGAE